MNPRSVSRLNSGRDRFTDLPDHIRLHILTLLPIKDAILTTLLSKGWINLWTKLTTLVFRFEPKDRAVMERAVHDFALLVDRTLLFHNSQYLDRFSVTFKYFPRHHQNPLHSWLRFAVNRNVKHLDLIFDHMTDVSEEVEELYEYEYPLCSIPSYLLRNDALVSLILKNCELRNCKGEIKCKSLKSLSISICGGYSLCDKFVAKLLLGCPVLEKFKLNGCDFDGLIDLNICHDGLKELVIKCFDYYGGKVRISAPNVTTLTLGGYILSKCQFSNLSSVVEAFVDLQYYLAFDRVEEVLTNIEEVLERMPNVKKLTVGFECLQALSFLVTTYPPFSISSCRSLVLGKYQNTSQLRGVAWLLRSCPQLETLIMKIKATTSLEDDNASTNFWKSQHSDGYFSCMDHLENVIVIGLVPHHPETKYVTEFIQFILEHGKVLKNLSIKVGHNDESTSDDHSLNSHFEPTQILSFPRLSRAAEIHLTML